MSFPDFGVQKIFSELWRAAEAAICPNFGPGQDPGGQNLSELSKKKTAKNQQKIVKFMKKNCPKNSRRYSSTPSSSSKSKMLVTALPPFLLTVPKAAAAFNIASCSLLKPLHSWYAQFPSSTWLAATRGVWSGGDDRQERCRGNMHEAKDVPF